MTYVWLLVLVFIGGDGMRPGGHVHSEHMKAAECRDLAAQFNAPPNRAIDGRQRHAVCILSKR